MHSARHSIDLEIEGLHLISVAVLEDQRQILADVVFPVFTTLLICLEV